MATDWRRLTNPRVFLAGAMALALAAGSAGCALRKAREAAEPPAAPPRLDEPVGASEVPAPLPPPPSEADLAIRAAREAEERGDYETALQLYGWASAAHGDRDSEAEIHYRRGVLFLDAAGGLQSFDEARRALEQVTAELPRSERHREARILLLLLDDLDARRTLEAALRAEVDALKAEVGLVKADLERKEQELRNIRQVLLQKTP